MKVLVAVLVHVMLAGLVCSYGDFANRQKSLLHYFRNAEKDVQRNADRTFLFQSVDQGTHHSFGDRSTRTQDVFQEGQGDVTVQNVIQGPTFHHGDETPAKPLQTQAVHQQGKGLVVVQNVVQGPTVHVPKYDFFGRNYHPWAPKYG
ncbi:uncharacterized protein [Penaeus vannamei]|uniref:uncharacterized protein n=1 Tax=Penaeus vannamei TaxID=6689 RepID=UPI00387F78BB